MSRTPTHFSLIRAGRRALLATAAIFLAFVLLAVVVPQVLTSADPLNTNAAAAFEPPGIDHPLGTDQVGRDVYTRIIYGALPSVSVGFTATVTSAVIGLLLGIGFAQFSSRARYSVSRSIEVLMALPEFLIALFIIAFLGKGPIAVLIALSLAGVPAYLNVARNAAVTARVSESVSMAKVLGLSRTRILYRYITPTSVQPVIGLASLGVGFMILSAAGLSYLGLGVQPPSPEWGVMLAESREYFERAWWLVLFPGLAITCTVGALTVLARALRAALR